MQPSKDINSAAVSLLKIISALAIVSVHTTAEWNFHALPVHSFIGFFNAALKGLCFSAVSLFVITSGYLLLRPEKTQNTRDFYRRRAWRVIPPLLLWSAFYLCVRALGAQGLSWSGALDALYHGMPYYHMWFLYMVVGLYLLAPFLERLLEAFTGWRRVALLGAIFAATWIYAFFKPDVHLPFFLEFLPYTGLFLLGGALNRVDVRPARVPAALGTVAMTLFLGPVMAFFVLNNTFPPNAVYSCAGMASALYAGCAFLTGIGWVRTQRFTSRKTVGFINRFTLDLYLIHPFWILVVSKAAMPYYTPAYYAISFVLIYFLSCAGAALLVLGGDAAGALRARFLKNSCTAGGNPSKS